MPPKNCWSFIKTVNAFDSYFETIPQTLQTLKNKEADLAMSAFGMSIAFLEDALISKQTITPGSYQIYQPESKSCYLDNMVLDSQALQHLEIVEAADGKLEGSLLNYVDLCQTAFGKRQIKKWLMAPLIDVDQIN